MPRKQLHNSLGQGLGVVPERIQVAAEAISLDPRKRPGDLGLEEWATLYRRLGEERAH